MNKQVLFVQGAGQGAYEEDAKLVASLAKELGPDFDVRYPAMPNEDSPDHAVWSQRLAEELATMGEGVILVGHSAGAATALADMKPKRSLAGIFLIAAPFCGDGGWDCGDFELPKDLCTRLPEGVPLFLYHGGDDDIVPLAHVELYAKALPQAVVRRLDGRNHQLNDDLSEVAHDIKTSRLGAAAMKQDGEQVRTKIDPALTLAAGAAQVDGECVCGPVRWSDSRAPRSRNRSYRKSESQAQGSSCRTNARSPPPFRKQLLTGDVAEFTCLVGTMVQETFESSPAIRAACEASISGHAAKIETDIAEAMQQRGLRAEWTARSLALHTQAILQGAFTLARRKVTRDRRSQR